MAKSAKSIAGVGIVGCAQSPGDRLLTAHGLEGPTSSLLEPRAILGGLSAAGTARLAPTPTGTGRAMHEPERSGAGIIATFGRRALSRYVRPFQVARSKWVARGLVLLAFAFAGGAALTQTSGCARCGSSPSAVPANPPAFSLVRREERPWRESRRHEERRPRREGGWDGSYMVCVRACDGAFFPMPYVGDGETLGRICQALCPNAKVALYSLPLGGAIGEASSATGETYDRLPNAHKFEQSYDSTCSCRRPGQSWAEALAYAEARYGHSAHDIVVTLEKSEEMSRPIVDPKVKAAQAGAVEIDAPQAVEIADPPSVELDINGVDTKLEAATAA
ncbi:MAG: DUF2865 domain-containing protein, partial [Hyphomicrobiales bacterium]|nr:DUF2865 domain-containing protein [Hyphomicrobiales bacterium]